MMIEKWQWLPLALVELIQLTMASIVVSCPLLYFVHLSISGGKELLAMGEKGKEYKKGDADLIRKNRKRQSIY